MTIDFAPPTFRNKHKGMCLFSCEERSLPWCPIEDFRTTVYVSVGSGTASVPIAMGPIKLDLTFRERKVHQQIQSHVDTKLKQLFDTDTQKLEYINKLRRAALTKNVTEYNKLKEWLRF